jgi:hypothetical protein
MSSSTTSFVRNYPITLDGIVKEQLNVQQQIQVRQIAHQQALIKLQEEQMKELEVFQEHLADLECMKQRRLNKNANDNKEFTPQIHEISTTAYISSAATTQANSNGIVSSKSEKTGTIAELASRSFFFNRKAPANLHPLLNIIAHDNELSCLITETIQEVSSDASLKISHLEDVMNNHLTRCDIQNVQESLQLISFGEYKDGSLAHCSGIIFSPWGIENSERFRFMTQLNGSMLVAVANKWNEHLTSNDEEISPWNLFISLAMKGTFRNIKNMDAVELHYLSKLSHELKCQFSVQRTRTIKTGGDGKVYTEVIGDLYPVTFSLHSIDGNFVTG